MPCGTRREPVEVSYRVRQAPSCGRDAGAHGALIRASGARESATGQRWNTSPALTMYPSHARASICCFEPRAPVPGCFFAHLQATPQQSRHATRRPPRTVVGNLLFSLKVRRSALRHLMERAWWWYRRPAPRSAHPLRPRGAAVSTREYVPISHHGNQPLSVGRGRDRLPRVGRCSARPRTPGVG